MSDSPGPATSNGGFRRWNTPVPYLFGGVGLLLCLITVALVILACSRKSSSSSSQGPNTEAAQEVDHGKINVVIMAGDDKPTYLANAVVSSSAIHHRHDVEAF